MPTGRTPPHLLRSTVTTFQYQLIETTAVLRVSPGELQLRKMKYLSIERSYRGLAPDDTTHRWIVSRVAIEPDERYRTLETAACLVITHDGYEHRFAGPWMKDGVNFTLQPVVTSEKPLLISSCGPDLYQAGFTAYIFGGLIIPPKESAKKDPTPTPMSTPTPKRPHDYDEDDHHTPNH